MCVAKAISLDARLLIMDEPTSSLTLDESKRLLAIIADLAAHGHAVVYISHRLHELTTCCQRAVVLRDGRNVGDLSGADLTHDRLVRLMVGRDLPPPPARTLGHGGAAPGHSPVVEGPVGQVTASAVADVARVVVTRVEADAPIRGAGGP